MSDSMMKQLGKGYNYSGGYGYGRMIPPVPIKDTKADAVGNADQMAGILNYTCPVPEVRALDRQKMNGIVIIGGMDCGKSTLGNYWITSSINRVLDKGYTDDRKIVYVHAYCMSMQNIVKELVKSLGSDLKKIEYIYMFNDDAIAGEGQHARESMKGENVATAKFYIFLRHIFERYGFKPECCLIPFHAAQLVTHLDKTFRRTCYMFLFKDYPVLEEPEQQFMIRQLGEWECEYLRDATFMRTAASNTTEWLDAMNRYVIKSADPIQPTTCVGLKTDSKGRFLEDPYKMVKVKSPVEPMELLQLGEFEVKSIDGKVDLSPLSDVPLSQKKDAHLNLLVSREMTDAIDRLGPRSATARSLIYEALKHRKMI